jgi:hypothetical protein
MSFWADYYREQVVRRRSGKPPVTPPPERIAELSASVSLRPRNGALDPAVVDAFTALVDAAVGIPRLRRLMQQAFSRHAEQRRARS